MKHATPAALERLALLLSALRRLESLREPRPGVFYLAGRAFLHFHEDPAGLFADLRLSADWDRLPVGDEAGQQRLLAAVSGCLDARARSTRTASRT